MADLIVQGGRPLSGTIRPSGNKNAVLPILCASLLTDEPVTLHRVPAITDVEKILAFLEAIGSRVHWNREAGTLTVCHESLEDRPDLIDRMPVGMRSSVLLFAPLLQRLGRLPLVTNAKGCTLGVREIDPHLDILRQFGARAAEKTMAGLVLPGGADGRLTACRYWQDYMSVTATETFLMAAVVADGTSTLINAASEPHVQNLCEALLAMGADIRGGGTSRLDVRGVDRLGGAEITIQSDFHEIVTFLALGAITGGEVAVEQDTPEHFDLIDRSFRKLGIQVEHTDGQARVAGGQTLRVQTPFTTNLLAKIEAAPWPYFPVDLLPVMIALAIRAEGAIHFWNKVYEGGFTWLPEVSKFGAHAVVSDPHRIIVFGNRPLRPATVDAPYIIRAAVALFMVAASIRGESTVRQADTIKRAHPHFVENLRRLGAEVRWA
ncbi:MAG: UDP-N-acetylglucosamine 1-carboxyvinyltransferase [Opitutales bacterium]